MVEKIKVAGKVRVSTHSQQIKKYLESQVSEIKKYANANVYELLEIYQDVNSKYKKGDGINKAMADAGKYQKLIASTLDRFGGTKIVKQLAEDLKGKGVALVSIEEGVDSLEDWDGFMEALRRADIEGKDRRRTEVTQKNRQAKIKKK